MRPRFHALAVLVGILAAGTLIAISEGRPSRFHVILAAGAGITLAASVALRGSSRRKALVFGAGATLAVLVPAAGWVSWHSRAYLERARFPWGQVLLDRPGLEAVRDARARGDDPGAEAALLAYFAGRAPRDVNTLAPLSLSETTRRSDEVLKGDFQFLSDEPITLPADLSWDEDPIGSRTWQWMLHTMDFILPLVERYRLTGEPRWLQRAEDLVFDWVRDNYLYFFHPPSRYSWHDHVTALRVRAWLVFWESWIKSGLASPGEARDLLVAIRAHGEKLADPEFYTEGHNHGLEQDLALMAIGVAFPELEPSSDWVRTGCSRFEVQVAATVSPAGVHLEHSANYHFFVLGILSRAVDFARTHSLPLDARRLQETLDRMARYGAHLLQPDARVPLLGDTTSSPPLTLEDPMLAKRAERDEVLRYVLSRGKAGAPGMLTAIYKDEGYAIFRDAWSAAPDFEKSLHLIFAAAAHPGRAHKQSDDLTILLYSGGRGLIVGPGLFSYSAKDAGRRHILSAASHNTVLVDGKGFEGYATRMERFAQDPAWGLVEASHDNYPGIRHRRLLFYVRPSTILIVDDLIPAGEGPVHEFEQLFHFDPAMEATLLGGASGVAARYPGGPSVRIEQLMDGRGGVAVLRGSEEPYRGWVSRASRKLEPTAVAVTKARGARASFATWIEARAGEPLAEGAGYAGAEVSVEPGRIAFRWPFGGVVRTAVITRDAHFGVQLDP